MRSTVSRIVMDGVAAVGSWPAFGLLMLFCLLCFGYLVPKAKAAIFADVVTKLPHKVLDEYFPTWTAEAADKFFADIGSGGRAAYRRFYWIMDFWFPGTAAALTTASLLLIAFPPTSGWAWLCLIAVVSWLLDVVENITHFQMAGSYPDLSPVAVTCGPSFTRLKWIFAIIPAPIALVGFVFQFLHGW